LSNKSYWFYLESYVYVSLKKNQLLLYNTRSGKFLEYDRNQMEIIKLIKNLYLKSNSYVIKITDFEIKSSPIIKQFIKDVTKFFMGDLIDASMVSQRPFQITPIMNLFREVKKLKEMTGRSVGEDIKKYLREINFYITNQCTQNCRICNKIQKQFIFCYKNNRKNELALNKIKYFLDESMGSSLKKVNFLGGDISRYSKINQLIEILECFSFKKAFYFHYLNLVNKEKILSKFAKLGGELNILIDFPLKEESFQIVFNNVNNKRTVSNWIFVIQNENDIFNVNQLKSAFNIKNISLKPFYNKKNILFFKKYVYINDKKSLFNSKLSHKELYCREMMNPLNFGKIFIKSDGKVITGYNGLSNYSKGGESSIYEAIFKEMAMGKNWFKTRTKVNPCKKCVFNCICPPLSNYESVIGQNNLCFKNLKNIEI